MTDETQPNWLTFAEEEGSIFDAFCNRFPSYFQDYLKWPAECAWKLGGTLATLDKDFRRAEAQYSSAIEVAVREFCSNPKSTSEFSPAVSYFLSVRGRVLGQFFQELTVETSPGTFESVHTIIPFPLSPPDKVLEWFLIDWWREHGPYRICKLRLVDELPVI